MYYYYICLLFAILFSLNLYHDKKNYSRYASLLVWLFLFLKKRGVFHIYLFLTWKSLIVCHRYYYRTVTVVSSHISCCFVCIVCSSYKIVKSLHFAFYPSAFYSIYPRNLHMCMCNGESIDCFFYSNTQWTNFRDTVGHFFFLQKYHIIRNCHAVCDTFSCVMNVIYNITCCFFLLYRKR